MPIIFRLLTVSVFLVLTAGFGFSETGTTGKAPAQSADNNAIVAAGTGEKGGGEKGGGSVNKDGVVTSQVMEKLSNAVGGDYIIGAEDVLDITVWRNVDLSKTVQVRPDGRVSMPIIRDITAVGKTPTQLAEEMTNKLKEYVQNPVVAVSLKEVNSYNIFLLGEVAHPGRYPLKSKTTLLQGITIAGGFTPIAARNQIVIFRFTESAPGIKRLTASYDEIVLRGGIAENFELKSGDTVVVPSEAMVVFPGR
jgi:polysaccharide export outer membrane protein